MNDHCKDFAWVKVKLPIVIEERGEEQFLLYFKIGLLNLESRIPGDIALRFFNYALCFSTAPPRKFDIKSPQLDIHGPHFRTCDEVVN